MRGDIMVRALRLYMRNRRGKLRSGHLVRDRQSRNGTLGDAQQRRENPQSIRDRSHG